MCVMPGWSSCCVMFVGLLSLEKKQYINWEIYIKCKGYYLKKKRQESYSLGEKRKLLKLLLEELEEQVLVIYTWRTCLYEENCLC